MSEPVTIEPCTICRQPFQIPMRKDRRRGGYYEGSADFTITYAEDAFDDIDLAMVCPNCAESIAEVARKEIERLKP
jgi:hypothetical protein